MDTELPQWLGILLGFMSVGPLMLLFSVKSIKEYGGPLGRLWHRLIEPRLDSVSRRYISFAVLAGMAGGFLSIPVVEYLNVLFFSDVSLAFRPREPMALLTQIAFVQAGLIEEVAKNVLGVILAFLICRAGPVDESLNSASDGNQRLFLKSTPFLFAGVGLGFALLENSQYIRHYAAMGPGGIFLGRSLIATSAHALLNLYFGLCLMTATRKNFPRTVFQALAIVVLWHGIYDFFALPPVALSQWFTLVFLCGIIFMTLSKMYRLLPELRYRPLRPADEVAAEDAAMSGIPMGTRPSDSEHSSRMSDVDDSVARMNLSDSDPSNLDQGDAGGPPTDQDWHERLAVLPPVPDRFHDLFVQDGWRLRFPESRPEMPYQLSEFEALSPQTLATLARPGVMPVNHRQLPEPLAASWTEETAWWCQAFQVDAPHSRWDVTAFAPQRETDAENQNETVVAATDSTLALDLMQAGVDLTRTVPFQVLEFRTKSPRGLESGKAAAEESGERHVYITQGLSELYERELLVSFSHPHPMVRWFFLKLASLDAAQAPWLREFHAFYSDDPIGLGDPRGWLRFYVTVPLIDPIAARIATNAQQPGVRFSMTDTTRENEAADAISPSNAPMLLRAAEDLPLQILMCAYPDGEYIARRGVPSYLQALRHLGYTWQNDFRRAPVAP